MEFSIKSMTLSPSSKESLLVVTTENNQILKFNMNDLQKDQNERQFTYLIQESH